MALLSPTGPAVASYTATQQVLPSVESAVTPPQVTESPNSASPSVKVPHILFSSESNLVPSIIPNSFATVPAELPTLRQRRKKKKKFEVKFDSLIQADIQQLQKRGSFSVKQEVEDDAKLLDIPTSNLVKSAPPETWEIPDDDHVAPTPGNTLDTDGVGYPGGPSADKLSQTVVQDSNPQSLSSTTIEHPFERITVREGQTNLDRASAPIDSTAISRPPPPDIFDPMEVDLPSPTEQKIASVVAPAGTPARQGSPEVELDAMISQEHVAADDGEGQGLDVVMHFSADVVSYLLSTEAFALNIVPLSKGRFSPKFSDGIPDGIDSNNHATPVTTSSPYTTPILPQTTPQLSTPGVSEAVASSLVIPVVIEDKGTLRMFLYLREQLLYLIGNHYLRYVWT